MEYIQGHVWTSGQNRETSYVYMVYILFSIVKQVKTVISTHKRNIANYIQTISRPHHLDGKKIGEKQVLSFMLRKGIGRRVSLYL